MGSTIPQDTTFPAVEQWHRDHDETIPEPTTPEYDQDETGRPTSSPAPPPSKTAATAAAAATALVPAASTPPSSSSSWQPPATKPAHHNPFVLSPPPTPRPHRSRTSGIKLRLRSNSGMSFHTNEDALRQYTDYNTDGTPRTPLFGSVARRGDATGTTFHNAVGEEIPPKLPIPDFFGRETLQLVFANPAIMERLLGFAESQRLDENVDFLIKLQGYHKLLDETLAHMSLISSAFTSVGATTPVRLPPNLTRALDNDSRQAANISIPNLRNMFAASKEFVEKRVSQTIYPDFLNRQLAACTGHAMSSSYAGSAYSPYPGLADAYCLAAPFANGNRLVCVSDGFAALTGHDWADDAGARDCRHLQGACTGRETAHGMREAILRGEEESVELVLDHDRRDGGKPFWNFLYACPLLDASGKLRYWFGAQVNVSHEIRSGRDILRILDYSPPPPHASAPPRRPLSQGAAGGHAHERDSSLGSLGSLESLQGKATRKSFFNPFRRSVPPSPNPSRPRPSADSRTNLSEDLTPGSRYPPSTSSSYDRRFPVFPHADAPRTAYGRFIVLENVDSLSAARPEEGGGGPSASERGRPRKGSSPALKVAFCSRGALEALGLGMAAGAVVGKDIFVVLAEQANSPSVGRSFRAAVRDAVLRGSETLRLYLVFGKGGGGGGGGDGGRRGTRRGMPPETYVSYWTPLKGADGNVDWVVLVVAPSLG